MDLCTPLFHGESPVKTRNELSAREVEALHQALMRRLGDTSVPTLPQVAIKVINLVSNPNSTIKQFAEVIRADQALTGRLLRMANSAHYAQSAKVTNIERAMILLGLERVKAVALGFHLSKAAAGDKGDFSTACLWAQSLFRGWFAMRLAEKVHPAVAAESFIVSLMADAGLPMMPKLIGQAYAKAINASETPPKCFLNEKNTFPFTHVDVAASMARIWNLPDVLRAPLGNHHTAPQAVSLKDSTSTLQAITYFANAIPLGRNAHAEVDDKLIRLAERYFQITSVDLTELVAQASIDVDACRALFADVIDESMNIDYIVDAANKYLGADETPVQDNAPARKILSFTIGDLQYQLEGADNNAVTVFIADNDGNRILSEQITPNSQTEQQIRETLMLDTADATHTQEIIQGIRSLAA